MAHQENISGRSVSRIAVVTGANGMIGRHIIGLLLRHGYRVRALVRNKTQLIDGVEVVAGDLSSQDSLRRLLEGADIVFHCAAELRDAAKMQAVNVDGTERFGRLAVEARVKVFCHLSSAGVVGPLQDRWIDESTQCHPANPYERSKWRAESYVQSLSGGDMRICILRPTNVIDDDAPGILALAFQNGWRGRVSLLIKGDECAHIIHARDVAAAALFVVETTQCSGCYVVGCDEDERNSVSALYNMCRQGLGYQGLSRIHLPAAIPYWLRCMFRGQSLHGHSRFSSSLLQEAGFIWPLGLDGAVDRICQFHRGATG